VAFCVQSIQPNKSQVLFSEIVNVEKIFGTLSLLPWAAFCNLLGLFGKRALLKIELKNGVVKSSRLHTATHCITLQHTLQQHTAT